MSKNILVVDDKETITRPLERTLRRVGYEISTVTSGAAEFDVRSNKQIDMITTEMRMLENGWV